ncbi:MAG: hypothetical protein HY877_07385 [Deltaproteobacteria bacterium]|nr:hypothetical protein [Deltaproteobacteria bacterium]
MIKTFAQIRQWLNEAMQFLLRGKTCLTASLSGRKPNGAMAENRIDSLVQRLEKEKRLDDLETELLKTDCQVLQPPEKERWYFYYGCMACRRGDRPAAMARFKQGAIEFPDSNDILFCLGQEHEHVGNVEEMFRLFDKTRFPALSGHYSMEQARYACLWGKYEKAVEYLWPVWLAYHKLGGIDDTFVYMRGLPFFNNPWGTLAVAFVRMGRIDEFLKITKKACRRFHDDFEYRRAHLESCRGNTGSWLEYVRTMIGDRRERATFRGYWALQLAILESQLESDLTKAGQILDAVTFSDKDFGWLEDVRLLANCELSHRKRDLEVEEVLQDRFMQKRPLLFEPHHVFDFHLMDYDEKLQLLYRKNKKQV